MAADQAVRPACGPMRYRATPSLESCSDSPHLHNATPNPAPTAAMRTEVTSAVRAGRKIWPNSSTKPPPRPIRAAPTIDCRRARGQEYSQGHESEQLAEQPGEVGEPATHIIGPERQEPLGTEEGGFRPGNVGRSPGGEGDGHGPHEQGRTDPSAGGFDGRTLDKRPRPEPSRERQAQLRSYRLRGWE